MTQKNVNTVAHDFQADKTSRTRTKQNGKSDRVFMQKSVEITDQSEGREAQLRLSALQAQSEREKRETKLQISKLNAEIEKLRLQHIKELEMARLDVVMVAASKEKRGKPVEQYNLATEKTIAWFISIEAASRRTEVEPTSIEDCLSGKQNQAGGWGWRTPGSSGAYGADAGAAAAAASPRGKVKSKQVRPGNANEQYDHV